MAESVCGQIGLRPNWLVAKLVCGRIDWGQIGLWPNLLTFLLAAKEEPHNSSYSCYLDDDQCIVDHFSVHSQITNDPN